MEIFLIILLAIFFIFGLVVLTGAPYVPSRKKLIQKAFKTLYPLSDKDLVVDIGSGDGVVLREAVAHGAKAVGYEINPILFVFSKIISRHPLISIRLADYRLATFPKETTLIYTFGDSRDIERMYRKAEETANRYKKDIYFMTFGFNVPKRKFIKRDKSYYLYRIRYLQRG